MIDDTKKIIAKKILNDELDIEPIELTRFLTGYCHSVYYVKGESGEYVLRLTGKENAEYYFGALKWLPKLAELEIPVPKILEHGQYEDVFYTLISYIPGKDLGEIYHELSGIQKREIAKELSMIQAKAEKLPTTDTGFYGYTDLHNSSHTTWIEYLKSSINRSRERIKKNGVLKTNVCDEVLKVMYRFEDYFSKVSPTAFLEDITTKNVLIHDGKLSGIVDTDEMCYGDKFFVVGLTNMSLLSMKADTDYIDYWLDELNADEEQRKAVTLYTLLFCIDFMAEQGMRFDNGVAVEYNQNKIDVLYSVYLELIEKIEEVSGKYT